MNANRQFQRRFTSPRVSRTTFRSTATNAWSRAASSEDTASRTASNCSRSSCSSRSCAEIPRYFTLIASISPPSEPATQNCTEEEVSNGISSCLSQNGKLAHITYLGTWPSLARCYRMTGSAHDQQSPFLHDADRDLFKAAEPHRYESCQLTLFLW